MPWASLSWLAPPSGCKMGVPSFDTLVVVPPRELDGMSPGVPFPESPS